MKNNSKISCESRKMRYTFKETDTKLKEAGTMLKKKTLIFLLVLTMTAIRAWGGESIVIEKTARTSNPSLVFQGVSGAPELNEALRSSFLYCGWFDVQKASPGVKSDYVISGQGTGNSVILRIENSAGVEVATVSARGDGPKDTAHGGVDAVLKELFGIAGICRSRIVFTADTGGGNRELYVCDFDGRDPQKITANRKLCMDPVWAPDGRTIIYSLFTGADTCLVQYDTVTKLSRRLSRYSGLNAGGAISPDGKTIALVLNRDNQVDLYIRSVEGTDLRRVTKDKAVEASPCWSPDGKKLCYVSDSSGRPLLYTVDPFRGGRGEPLRGLAGSERVTPCWSPSGKLTYSAKVGRDYIVAVADMSQGKPVMETVGPEGKPASIVGEGPSWAPDGRHVVTAENGAIYIVDTWLGKKRPLFSKSARLNQPDWSPLLKK